MTRSVSGAFLMRCATYMGANADARRFTKATYFSTMPLGIGGTPPGRSDQAGGRRSRGIVGELGTPERQVVKTWPRANGSRSAAGHRQLLAKNRRPTKMLRERDFGNPRRFLPEPRRHVSNSSSLVMVRKSTAEDPETFAMDSRWLFRDPKRDIENPSRAIDDRKSLIGNPSRAIHDCRFLFHDSKNTIGNPRSLVGERICLADDS